ncbi:hypothetical protein ABZ319_13825 [Nocardia sp. NPDC005978]|uniref:hypothetical protein n=1 Tax=Nocardia sp. NPDC005978 TaxID=3156725 RepID=UPI00339E883D
MNDAQTAVTHPELGVFERARTELTDGQVLEHDWYEGRALIANEELELMLETSDPDSARALLPVIATAVGALPTLSRIASDAVVGRFGDQPPTPEELEEAATDLRVVTVAARMDGTVVLHFEDTCGEHFLEGYWPAVVLDSAFEVLDITVEA